MTDNEWPWGRAFPDPLPWRALRRGRRIKGVSLVILNAVNILINNNQILRKRGSEWQLLFLVGWLSRGIGWYGFHDDDPTCDRIFRNFLNILSLGSCFQSTKMRNSRSKDTLCNAEDTKSVWTAKSPVCKHLRLLRASQWQIKARCLWFCHCEPQLWHVVYYFVSNLNSLQTKPFEE